MIAKPKAQIHTKLDTPIRIRKLILESAIETTKLQQYLKNFKTIKKQKLEQQRMFKQVVREVKDLFNKIEFESLPDLSKSKKVNKPQKKSKRKKTITKQEIEEMEKPIKHSKLEQELYDIKNKLNNLEF